MEQKEGGKTGEEGRTNANTKHRTQETDSNNRSMNHTVEDVH